MSDKQHPLRFTPAYMAIAMAGALVAMPAWAQTTTANTLETAAAATAVTKDKVAKKAPTASVILSDITVDGL